MDPSPGAEPAPVGPSPRALTTPALVVAALAAGVCLLHFAITFRGLDASDAFSYAHIARNLARGRGYVTQESMPYEFRRFHAVPHAELMHPPLQAITLSAAFRLFGPREWAAVLPSGCEYVLLVVIAFLAASRLAGRGAGALAAAAVITQPALGNYSVSGLAEAACALTITAALVLIAFSRDETRLLPALAVGAALGLADLGRETARYLLPIAVVALWGGRAGRPARLGGLLAGFAGATLPNFARIAAATGNPFTSYGRDLLMADMPPFRGLDWYRSFSPIDPLLYVTDLPGPFEAKIGFNLALIVARLYRVLSPVLLLGAVLAAGWAAPPAARRLARMTLAALLLQVGVSVLFRIDLRHFVPYAPLLAIVTAVFLATLARRAWLGRALAALLAALLLAPQAWARAQQFHSPSPRFERRLAAQRAVGRYAAEACAPNSVVVTDASEVVAWFADRRTVWFPLTESLLDRIPRQAGEEQYLLLTTLGVPDRPERWLRYLELPYPPPGFEHVSNYHDSTVVARLYRRKGPALVPATPARLRPDDPDSLARSAR